MQSYQGGYGKTPNYNINAGCDRQYTHGVEVSECDSCHREFPTDDLTQFVDPITRETFDLCAEHFTERWCELADDVMSNSRVWLYFFSKGGR